MDKFKALFLGLGILLFLGSCDKEVESIPSYLYISNFTFSTNYSLHGYPSAQIEDVTVIVNNREYGTFTLPVLVPIDAEGDADVILIPGIRVNGTLENRQTYDMYVPYETEVNLTRKEVDSIQPATTYKTNVKLVWIEDFEDQALNLVRSVNDFSNDTIEIIDSSAVNSFRPAGLNSMYTGYIDMGTTDSVEIFEYVTINSWNVPNGDNDVFLEVDYKTNKQVQFGIYADKNTVEEQIGVYVVNPTEEWKKIYINLKTETGFLDNSDRIKIFIGVFNKLGDPVDAPKIYLDNLKVVHLN